MRIVFLFILLVSSQLSFATTKQMQSAVIAPAASAKFQAQGVSASDINAVFQAVGTVSASTGAATVKLQGSNDGTNWVDIGSITLTLGTAATSDKVVDTQNWLWVRSNVTAISGTNATVNTWLNY
jgi:hypothetical protein